ncbi:TAXI family TRAP transporter solute-binding subunit [Hyphomicrobium sp. NDB2Meth4]|uniref:TAXI family TRAP transporter solute-binding subunit n=1 Tax=Hyphomicrobium sp. NDB2Meth4 TaxID=1892846 RepID=UPI000931F621|nr:TAXI family TRAP transporter solute-binding subunit [Hyphomicrobium sp. NDB2Meth4]
MNLPKAITFIAVAAIALLSAGYYWATGQRGAEGKIVLATGDVANYRELAAAYEKALDPYGVDVQLRPAVEGFQTLKGLVSDPPQFDAAFIKGGLVGSMQGRLARAKAQEWQQKELGKLRSLGRLFYEPIWVFVRSDFAGQSLRDLKGKAVLTGTRESGGRRIAAQLLRANGIEFSKDNPLMIAEDIAPDGNQLLSGKAEAAFLVQPADTPLIQSLLHVEGIRLLNFALEADAYANRFPALTKVTLNRGAVEFEPLSPPEDVTLLATSTALVVRADLDPSLISLLSFAVLQNPRSGFDKAGDPVLFHRPGTFPHISDPEYRVPEETRQVYKSGELPVALRSIAPAVKEAGFPFSVSAFISNHGAQTVLLLIPSLVILLPILRVLPSVYNWTVRRRLLYWYRQLKALEKQLDDPVEGDLAAHQAEIERIDSGVRKIRYPLAFSDQFYHLRLHINLVRQRLFQKPHVVRMAAE